jgi:transposase
VLVATKPVDFRKGAEGLAALVRETMQADPFSGAVYVFRAKRAHQTSFCLPFELRAHRISLASAQRPAAADRATREARGR